MEKKVFIFFLYFMFIVFLFWWVFFLFNKSLGFWIINWWNISKFEIFLNDI